MPTPNTEAMLRTTTETATTTHTQILNTSTPLKRIHQTHTLRTAQWTHMLLRARQIHMPTRTHPILTLTLGLPQIHTVAVSI
jgi:hypothetical protein